MSWRLDAELAESDIRENPVAPEKVVFNLESGLSVLTRVVEGEAHLTTADSTRRATEADQPTLKALWTTLFQALSASATREKGCVAGVDKSCDVISLGA